MNIHEYQGKELLKTYGVSVLEGHVAWTPEEAVEAAKKLPGPVYVVKSQIHAGGRGAGKFKDAPAGKGGVRLAKSLDEVQEAAAAMLGHTLITKQTGPLGRVVRRVYVEAGCDIKRELYLSLLIDRSVSEVVIIASTEGGMHLLTPPPAFPPSTPASWRLGLGWRASRLPPSANSFRPFTRRSLISTARSSKSTRWL
jgi:succinyl-CoA synthetase beta subunit